MINYQHIDKLTILILICIKHNKNISLTDLLRLFKEKSMPIDHIFNSTTETNCKLIKRYKAEYNENSYTEYCYKLTPLGDYIAALFEKKYND